MMEELTLVVMAAGMGSRFGGLKQITPIDEDGNFIIDYSVYDAIRAGFSKIVFVIKRENLEIFKETIGKRLESKINVCYAFQDMDDIPCDKKFDSRVKPWGTVQAVLCTRPYVNAGFAVINADDFYGYDAFYQAATFLKNENHPYTYASISYPIENVSNLGQTVKRGVITLEDDKVTSIIESKVTLNENDAFAEPLNGSLPFSISKDASVSMNIFAFQHDVYSLLEDYFKEFFQQDDESILSGEALLPECLEQNLQRGSITILNRLAHSKWLGMTYKEDLEVVIKEIVELKKNSIYPEHLWW